MEIVVLIAAHVHTYHGGCHARPDGRLAQRSQWMEAFRVLHGRIGDPVVERILLLNLNLHAWIWERAFRGDGSGWQHIGVALARNCNSAEH